MDKPDYCPYCQSPSIDETSSTYLGGSESSVMFDLLRKWLCQSCGHYFWTKKD